VIDKIDKLGNKPVTPDRELLELLKEWVAPDVSESKKNEYTGKTSFLGTPLDELYSKVIKEEPPEEEEIPPLTAEEIEQIRQDAYNEGFELGKAEGFQTGEAEGLVKGHETGLKNGQEQGYLAGLEQGQFEISEKVARLKDLAHQLYYPIQKVDKIAEQQLLNLVVMLAESVIRHETKSNKDALLSVLHEATASLPFNTQFAEIHMHPDDLKLLSETYTDEAMAEQKWVTKQEPGYQPGDIIVMTPNSLIDRTVKQRIRQSLELFIEKAELDRELNDHSPEVTRHVPKNDKLGVVFDSHVPNDVVDDIGTVEEADTENSTPELSDSDSDTTSSSPQNNER
jgi:flagellar assembly protein FliH